MLQLLARWLSELPVELFGGRVIRAMQRHVSSLAKAGMQGGHRENVLKAAQVMVAGVLGSWNGGRPQENVLKAA